MAAGSTYIPIATYTTSGSQTSYTFSSIPSTYTDLVLIANGKVVNNGDFLYVQFNGDTGSNYSRTQVQGTGSAAQSGRGSNETSGYIGVWYSVNSTIRVNFQNYSNTTTYKTYLSRSDAADQNTSAWVGLWRNTAAINSIKILSSAITDGTTFTLYGIAAA